MSADLKRADAPHMLKHFKRDQFMDWLDINGGTVLETTNEYEVIRYRKWCDGDGSRPTTHIVYRRRDGSLTYTGKSREHYTQAMGA